jgi:hypothetical protein
MIHLRNQLLTQLELRYVKWNSGNWPHHSVGTWWKCPSPSSQEPIPFLQSSHCAPAPQAYTLLPKSHLLLKCCDWGAAPRRRALLPWLLLLYSLWHSSPRLCKRSSTKLTGVSLPIKHHTSQKYISKSDSKYMSSLSSRSWEHSEKVLTLLV